MVQLAEESIDYPEAHDSRNDSDNDYSSREDEVAESKPETNQEGPEVNDLEEARRMIRALRRKNANLERFIEEVELDIGKISISLNRTLVKRARIMFDERSPAWLMFGSYLYERPGFDFAASLSKFIEDALTIAWDEHQMLKDPI